MEILVADDQPLICSGVKSTLEATSFCTRVYETYSNEGVWNILSMAKINLLIMELSLPGNGGMSMLRNLKAFYKDLPC